jgi:hypothetical protein
MVRTLLKPQWTVPERASTPVVEPAFQFIDTESESKAKFRKQELLMVARVAFWEQLGISLDGYLLDSRSPNL